MKTNTSLITHHLLTQLPHLLALVIITSQLYHLNDHLVIQRQHVRVLYVPLQQVLRNRHQMQQLLHHTHEDGGGLHVQL